MDYLRKKRGFSWVLGDRLLGLGVGNKKGQVFAFACKNLTFADHYLCRLALCSRYFAFCLADPEP
jgi:hypothetical protein